MMIIKEILPNSIWEWVIWYLTSIIAAFIIITIIDIKTSKPDERLDVKSTGILSVVWPAFLCALLVYGIIEFVKFFFKRLYHAIYVSMNVERVEWKGFILRVSTFSLHDFTHFDKELDAYIGPFSKRTNATVIRYDPSETNLAGSRRIYMIHYLSMSEIFKFIAGLARPIPFFYSISTIIEPPDEEDWFYPSMIRISFPLYQKYQPDQVRKDVEYYFKKLSNKIRVSVNQNVVISIWLDPPEHSENPYVLIKDCLNNFKTAYQRRVIPHYTVDMDINYIKVSTFGEDELPEEFV